MKEYMKTDAIGTHRVIEKANGITIKILKNPSEEYMKKKKESAKRSEKKIIEQKEKQKKEKLIQQKIRELAIAELEREGKI